MKKILIYGSLEFGQVIKNLVTNCGKEFAGFIDDFNSGDEIIGNLAKVSEMYSTQDYAIVIAIGYKNLEARHNIFLKVRALGYETPALIHPKSYIDDTSKVGNGSIIMASAVIECNSHIGDITVVWPGVVVNHDSRIGANTFLSPNSTICGCVEIGTTCFIGAGAVVVDHTTVPPSTFIKAGAVFHNKGSA